MDANNKPLYLKDAFSQPLFEGDIVFYNGHYYTLYYRDTEILGFACTDGYIHHVNQEMALKFHRIGPETQNRKYQECD